MLKIILIIMGSIGVFFTLLTVSCCKIASICSRLEEKGDIHK